MKYLLLALTLVLSSVAFANADEMSDPGKDAAYAQCARMPFDSDRTACIKIVAAAKYFDASAVNACGKSQFFSDIVTCINSIKDKWFQNSLVRTCERNPFKSELQTCLGAIGDKEADEQAVTYCNKNISFTEIFNCIKGVMRPYNPPTPTPVPTPTPGPVCNKQFVMDEFDIGLKFLTEYKVMDAFQKFNGLKLYLQACLQ